LHRGLTFPGCWLRGAGDDNGVCRWRLQANWVAVMGTLRGHFDILGLITRGLTRNRRLFNLRNISAVVSMMAAANCSGGKGRLVGDLAADHSDRAHEGDPVWVEFFGFDGSVDQGSDGVVDEQVGVDLLGDHLG